jgi:hypothetical protein
MSQDPNATKQMRSGKHTKCCAIPPIFHFLQYCILLKPLRDLLSQTLHLEIENYNGDYNQQKLENMMSEGSRRMGTFPNHRQLPKRDWWPLICSPRAST